MTSINHSVFGFHYLNASDRYVLVQPRVTSPRNAVGVYKADVTIDGHTKMSTMFPDHLTPEQIKDAVYNAANNPLGHFDGNSKYISPSGYGFDIDFRLNSNGVVTTFFPDYK